MFATQLQIKMLDRLLKRSDFLRAQGQGRKWVSKGVILQAVENTEADKQANPRFGLTVSKKISKSAVVRNRIRRRLRAAARDVMPDHAKTGYDYVLIGRIESADYPYESLKADLKWCLKRLECLKEKAAE